MQRNLVGSMAAGLASVLGTLGVAGVAAMPPGSSDPVCRFSLEAFDNEGPNADCTLWYYCCIDYYGVDHGPGSDEGTHKILGDPVMSPCNGAVYSAFIDHEGICRKGVWLGGCSNTVQEYPDQVLCS
jgi:hypothetical protein